MSNKPLNQTPENQKLEELQKQIELLQKQILNQNVEKSREEIRYPGMGKLQVISDEEYNARFNEIEASNQKKVMQTPKFEFDEKGNIIGVNASLHFAKANGYEGRAYMRVGSGYIDYILNINEILKIDTGRPLSGFSIQGVRVEGDTRLTQLIEVKDIPAFRLPETVEEATEIVKLKKLLKLL